MRIKPQHQEAFHKLFGNPLSVAVMIDIVKRGEYHIPVEEKEQHWKSLFGDKTKTQVLMFLERLQRAKDYDFKLFTQTFAKKIHKSL